MFLGTKPYRELIDWAAVQVYHDAGHGFVACQKKFGFTHGAWNKAISRGRLRTAPTPFRDRRRKYDWTEVQRYHDEGHSARACCRRFGFCIEAWFKAKKRGEFTDAAARITASCDLAEEPRAVYDKTPPLAGGSSCQPLRRVSNLRVEG